MEEVKEVSTSEGCKGMCGHMHGMCSSKHCFMKWVVIALVLAGVFALGAACGGHYRGDGYEGRGDFRGGRMMMQGGYGVRGGDWGPAGAQEVQGSAQVAPGQPVSGSVSATATPKK